MLDRRKSQTGLGQHEGEKIMTDYVLLGCALILIFFFFLSFFLYFVFL